MTTQDQEQPAPAEHLPPLETPNDDTRHCLALLQPMLEMTVNELTARGQVGWAGYLAAVYNSIDDVMSAAHAEGAI